MLEVFEIRLTNQVHKGLDPCVFILSRPPHAEFVPRNHPNNLHCLVQSFLSIFSLHLGDQGQQVFHHHLCTNF